MRKLTVVFCLLFAVFSLSFSFPVNAVIQNIPIEQIEQLILENGADFYAYMDLDRVDENMKAVILKAREKIIFSSTGWVADGTEGYVLDEKGNIIEVLPEFHDIFPEDWEYPVYPTSPPLTDPKE